MGRFKIPMNKDFFEAFANELSFKPLWIKINDYRGFHLDLEELFNFMMTYPVDFRIDKNDFILHLNWKI